MSHLFEKGKSGNPGGRPPGSKNKIRHDVGEICRELGCSPFRVLALIANGDAETLELSADQKRFLTVRLRMEAAAELAQYLSPKLKSIELKNDEESPFTMTINTRKCNCGNVDKPQELPIVDPALMAP